MYSAENPLTWTAPKRRVLIGVPDAPPAWTEFAYYAVLVYAVMCTAWHIAIPMFGTLALAGLTVVCAHQVVLRSDGVRQALLLPMLCAAAILGVQMFVHGEPLLGDIGRTILTWIMTLIVLQAMSLRGGFLHRFALVCFCISLLMLPYAQFMADAGGSRRLTLDRQVGVANSNDLGAWFGFCSLYFIVLATETKRLSLRVVACVCAIGMLLLLGLTVSRGPLISVTVATLLALRRVLRRGFLPLTLVIVAVLVAYGLGVFDQVVTNYEARGTVDSGRLSTWPVALARIKEAPLFGVGIRNIASLVISSEVWITPHNAYIWVALSSGGIACGLFIAYLARATWRAVRYANHPALRMDQALRLPLLAYTVLSCITLDYVFMSQWAVACLCASMCALEVRRVRDGYPQERLDSLPNRVASNVGARGPLPSLP